MLHTHTHARKPIQKYNVSIFKKFLYHRVQDINKASFTLSLSLSLSFARTKLLSILFFLCISSVLVECAVNGSNGVEYKGAREGGDADGESGVGDALCGSIVRVASGCCFSRSGR
jgi:hypothetical protein